MTNLLLQILGLVHLVLAPLVCAHILLTKEDPRAAVAWCGLVLFSPLLGSLLYYLFGINRIRRRAGKLRKTPQAGKERSRAMPCETDPGEQPHLAQMTRLGLVVHEEPFCTGNAVTPLVNGDQAYPPMLAAIDNAKRSVALSTYILKGDKAGTEFLHALSRAAKRGVSVRVMVDSLGLRKFSRAAGKELRESGVRSARFMPAWTKGCFRLLNLRNHRKMLLLDGELGFMGGMNLHHGNLLQDSPAKPIQDMHFRVAGPVLDQVATIFERDWRFATGEHIQLPRWPGNSRNQVGDVLARAIPDGPDDDFEKIQWTFLGALACARKSVRILTPYFLPDQPTLVALQTAAMRGVTIEVVMPDTSHSPALLWAMQAGFHHLLPYGIRLYYEPLPFDHSKLMLMDDEWCSIGSTNWDTRSFKLNFELNLECLDKELAAGLAAIFEERRSRARPVDKDRFMNLPPHIRLRNNLVRLFSPYL